MKTYRQATYRRAREDAGRYDDDSEGSFDLDDEDDDEYEYDEEDVRPVAVRPGSRGRPSIPVEPERRTAYDPTRTSVAGNSRMRSPQPAAAESPARLAGAGPWRSTDGNVIRDPFVSHSGVASMPEHTAYGSPVVRRSPGSSVGRPDSIIQPAWAPSTPSILKSKRMDTSATHAPSTAPGVSSTPHRFAVNSSVSRAADVDPATANVLNLLSQSRGGAEVVWTSSGPQVRESTTPVRSRTAAVGGSYGLQPAHAWTGGVRTVAYDEEDDDDDDEEEEEKERERRHRHSRTGGSATAAARHAYHTGHHHYDDAHMMHGDHHYHGPHVQHQPRGHSRERRRRRREAEYEGEFGAAPVFAAAQNPPPHVVHQQPFYAGPQQQQPYYPGQHAYGPPPPPPYGPPYAGPPHGAYPGFREQQPHYDRGVAGMGTNPGPAPSLAGAGVQYPPNGPPRQQQQQQHQGFRYTATRPVVPPHEGNFSGSPPAKPQRDSRADPVELPE